LTVAPVPAAASFFDNERGCPPAAHTRPRAASGCCPATGSSCSRRWPSRAIRWIRENRRLFGAPPGQDTARLRAAIGPRIPADAHYLP